jgi:hypothetical protein
MLFLGTGFFGGYSLFFQYRYTRYIIRYSCLNRALYPKRRLFSSPSLLCNARNDDGRYPMKIALFLRAQDV